MYVFVGTKKNLEDQVLKTRQEKKNFLYFISSLRNKHLKQLSSKCNVYTFVCGFRDSGVPK